MDLIRQYCAGAGKRFSEVVCEFYERLSAECHLLLQEKLELIFQKGRCKPRRLLEAAISRNLASYKDDVVDLKKDLKKHVSSLAFIILKRLQDKRLKRGYNLAVLIGYINRAAYTEVIQFIKKEGLLAKDRLCDSCAFLSEIKPYVCRRENIEVQVNGVTEFKSNPFYIKERKKTDKCREGFQARLNLDKNIDVDDHNQKEISGALRDSSGIEESINRMEIEDIKKLLKQRATDTRHNNTKKIYKRQYSVFVNLYHYIHEGYSVRGAMQLIAEKIGKNVKTIERDFNEIKSFLTKEVTYS